MPRIKLAQDAYGYDLWVYSKNGKYPQPVEDYLTGKGGRLVTRFANGLYWQFGPKGQEQANRAKATAEALKCKAVLEVF